MFALILIGISRIKQVAALFDQLRGHIGLHQFPADADHFVRGVGDMAKLFQPAARHHQPVDHRMTSGEEAVQQFQFQPGRLEGDQGVYLCIVYQPVHLFFRRISFDADIRIGSRRFRQRGGPCRQ